MAQNSFALMTTIGRAKEAAALANGTPIQITHIAIGDGSTIPSGGETELYHEVARKTISANGIVIGATNTAYFDCFLSAAEGPYTIREAGLYDSEGDLIAIARYDPPINKPVPASGQVIEATIRLEVAFSDTANIVVVIDPAMKVALQRLTRLPWIPVVSMTVNVPPASPAVGDTYLIAAGASGAWAGQDGKLAEYTTAGWAILAPKGGHGISLPNGSVFVRVAGIYVEFAVFARQLMMRGSDLAVKAWRSSPPVGPHALGDAYVVKSPGAGAWENQSHKLAVWNGSAWLFSDAVNGLQANYNDGGRFAVIWFDGAAWQSLTGTVKPAVVTTFYVKADGSRDFLNLTACFNYLRGFTIPPDAEVIVRVEGNLNEPETVDLYHTDGPRISVIGQAMPGAFPVFADFTGNAATDGAMLRTRFASVLSCTSRETVAFLVGSRLKRLENFLFVAPTVGSGNKPVLQIGEIDVSNFTRTGFGGVFIKNCWFHGGGLPLWLRCNADLVYDNLGVSHAYGSAGARFAQRSFASSLSGVLRVFHCAQTGVAVWFASSLSPGDAAVEVRNCGQSGVQVHNNSFARLFAATIKSNALNNVHGLAGSIIDLTNADAATSGSGTDILAANACFIDGSGSTGTVSPAANTLGNSNAYIKR
jgi:hypothetical protein